MEYTFGAREMHRETAKFGAFAVFGAAIVMACAVVLLAGSSTEVCAAK